MEKVRGNDQDCLWRKNRDAICHIVKKTLYSDRPERYRAMKHRFAERRNFWRLLGEDTKQTLIKHAKKHTFERSEERRQLELALAEYPHNGPMGSQDPKLAVDVVHLEPVLADQHTDLQEQRGWKPVVVGKDTRC